MPYLVAAVLAVGVLGLLNLLLTLGVVRTLRQVSAVPGPHDAVLPVGSTATDFFPSGASRVIAVVMGTREAAAAVLGELTPVPIP
uniref:Uncharacterized protein n=1 Tax=Cryptosporangium arvum DSM 44712 TaxID=927661 RepID=A0A010YQB0_9ACTN|nr:hypothetical protein [Cryptosporangium arvum]EXG82380.1 hypothetical protein CryarDRAFT_3558 [Cryptosporangium arvum DSM 44712]